MVTESPANIFTADYENFQQRVLAASQLRPVLVDLWAEWCSPCIVIAPLLEQVVTGFKGSVALAKVEVDAGENMKLAGSYSVRGFPTVILFQGGEERARFSGAQSIQYIKAFIEQNADMRPASERR